MDFRAIKMRYHAAFAAYNQILSRNASKGEPLSPADMESEKKALSTLEDARRELFAAFAARRPF